MSVLVGGEDLPIEFAADSDPRLLGALVRLKGDVLLPSAAQGRLHVVEWLRPAPKRTPDQPNMGTPEAHRELRLASRYLEAPFGRYPRNDVDGIPAVTGTELRTGLGLDEFGTPGPLAEDLALLVKPG